MLISKLWKKLRNPNYRHAFTRAHAKEGIAFQVKALRTQQQLSQAQLASKGGIDQSSVSRAENPESGDLSLNTLLGIAEGFDVALVCEFVPFSELVGRHKRLPHVTASIETFDEQDRKDTRAEAVASTELAHGQRSAFVGTRKGPHAKRATLSVSVASR